VEVPSDPQLSGIAADLVEEPVRAHSRRVWRYRVGPADSIEHGCGVADRSRDDTVCGRFVQKFGTVGPGRNEPPAGLQPEQTTAGSGDAYRAAAIGRGSHRHDPGGDRGGRAARGATWCSVGVPWIA